MKLYLATSNPGKVKEFLAAGLDVDVLPGLAAIGAPEETGSTFEENAILKALYYASHTAEAVIAEDSGLAVDSLGGAPGIYSARYAARANAGEGDEANNRHLIAQLQGQTDRRARYVAVIALAQGNRILGTFSGQVEGEIVDNPRGVGGFGYDPHFFHPISGRTFAEISRDEKTALSHRGAAIRKLSAWLKNNASS